MPPTAGSKEIPRDKPQNCSSPLKSTEKTNNHHNSSLSFSNHSHDEGTAVPAAAASGLLPPTTTSSSGLTNNLATSIGSLRNSQLSNSSNVVSSSTPSAVTNLATSLRLNPYDLRPLALPSPLDAAFINAAQQVGSLRTKNK